MKISILDDYQQVIASLHCYEMLRDHEVQVIYKHHPDPTTLIDQLADTEALVLNRTRTAIGPILLSALPKLKLISQTGKNAGHIDIEACTRAGVAVAESKGDPVATAELTWALIMNGLRQLPQAISAMREGRWQTNLGRRVKGQIIGIWGYGRIGKLIAHYARAFGATVLVWGSKESREQAVQDGYLAANSRLSFFQEADVVSLHLRLKEATRGIVKLSDLKQMKTSALLINTSRAALFEAGALVTALQAGRPGFAAIDVFDEEPIYNPQHPLLQMSNVICTPHLGYVERESYELYFSQAFQNVLNFINGHPTNIANSEVLMP